MSGSGRGGVRAVLCRLMALCALSAHSGCAQDDESNVTQTDVMTDARVGDPSLLSSRGLYRDLGAREVVEDAFEYEPDYALWSDGANKRRWLILPAGGQID